MGELLDPEKESFKHGDINAYELTYKSKAHHVLLEFFQGLDDQIDLLFDPIVNAQINPPNPIIGLLQ